MAQTREEMKKNIQKATKRKILRRQMELLAEYSRTSGTDKIPESSVAVTAVHNELVKAERIFFMRLLITFFGLLYLIRRIPIKGIELVRRQ